MNWNIQEKLLISFSGIENMNFQADPTQKDTTNDTVRSESTRLNSSHLKLSRMPSSA